VDMIKHEITIAFSEKLIPTLSLNTSGWQIMREQEIHGLRLGLAKLLEFGSEKIGQSLAREIRLARVLGLIT